MKIKHSLKLFSTNHFGASLLISSLLFTSCIQEQEQRLPSQETQSITSFYDKAGIENAELNEKLDYKSFHLTKLMAETIRINPDFDSQLTSKSNDGEHLGASYFNDLLGKSHARKNGANTNDSIQFSLEAFRGLGGESWYPYLRKIKEGEKGSPLFLINSYDTSEEKEIVQGYEPNEEGKLVLAHKRVLEDDVFGSDTGRAAVNGNVYAIELTPCLETAVARCTGGGGGGSGGSTTTTVAKIGYMIIKNKKESWLARAEVTRQSYSSESPVSGRLYGPCSTGCDNKGHRIIKIRNRDVRKRKVKRVNHQFYSGTVGSGNTVSYVIYERDAWPAHLRQYNEYVNGARFRFRYRSWDPPYDQNTITLNRSRPYGLVYGLGITRNNNDIEYNIVR
ncbi:hypothetical protein WIW50_11535 [Flavobacteriaceae bacterium 3-367]